MKNAWILSSGIWTCGALEWSLIDVPYEIRKAKNIAVLPISFIGASPAIARAAALARATAM